jgi:hypothetical protein
MTARIRFPYTIVNDNSMSLMPRLTFDLLRGDLSVRATGLVDSGATVNVLPYRLGVELGARWEQHKPLPALGGNLGGFEARALLLAAVHPQLAPDDPVEFIFAWSRSDDAPVLFGQMNFFLAFDVCFFRSENAFEVRRRSL